MNRTCFTSRYRYVHGPARQNSEIPEIYVDSRPCSPKSVELVNKSDFLNACKITQRINYTKLHHINSPVLNL